MVRRYEVRVLNHSGTVVAVFDSWRYLEIEHTLNSFSTHTFSIDLNDSRIALFSLDYFVQVRRSDLENGLAWYTEYIGFHRTQERQITEEGRRIFTSYGRGLVDLLHRREIRYYAGTAYVDKTGPADDIMQAFVDENAGPSATPPPRIVDGVTPGLSVMAAVSAGPNWEGGRAWNNLLDVIQEISKASGVDFDVVWLGSGQFEFRTYYPRRGTDHSSSGSDPVIFAPELGNMVAPTYTHSRTEEVNDVLVLGQGQESDRDTVLRTSTATLDSPWNLIEGNYDSRQEDTVAALQAAGDARLEELQAQESFKFQVLQQPATLYGADYVVGDLVTARFGSIERDKKIIGASIQVSGGKEEISVEFSDVP